MKRESVRQMAKRSLTSCPTSSKKFNCSPIKTKVCGSRDIANSSVGPLLSDGSTSCSRTRSCSPSSRRTTTKTTGAGPLRLPARRPLSNTAKIRSPSWSGAESALVAEPPRFRGSRSQNQPRSLPTRHSRDCGTSVGPTALRRCELDVPTGLCPCSQGENNSILVGPIFRTSSRLRNGRPTRRISARWVTACGQFWRPGAVLHAT